MRGDAARRAARERYRLVLEDREIPGECTIDHRTTARIEKVDPSGAVVASRLLLEGQREETTCD